MTTADRKRELRQEAQARRDALPAAEIDARSVAIARRVMSLGAYRRARSRLLFMSVGSEVRTDRLVADSLRSRARVILPRVVGPEDALALHGVCDLEREVVPGWMGIPEPVPGNCPEYSPDEVDFILVPGLAFDRRGGRLGYGGGYFDYILNLRTDLHESGAVVAVAFALQIVDAVPRESWDARVPIIVTEDELIDTRRGRS